MKTNKKTDEKKRLTRKEKEELVKKLYEQGYTYREIAKKLRISVRDISRILKGEERKDEIDEIKERLSKLEEQIPIKKEIEVEDRYLEAFKIIDRSLIEEGALLEARLKELGFTLKNIHELFNKYVDYKLDKESLKDLLRFILNCLLTLKIDWETYATYHDERLEELEERLYNASYMIRHALGEAGIKIRCPKCHEWSYLVLKEIKTGKTTEKKWVCSNCNQVPF